jgi:predicted kinase
MNLQNLKTYIYSLNQPFVIFLVGPPLSGKDTLIRNLQLSNVVVVSRDDIVLELCPGMNYNDAFKSVNQKLVNRMLKDKLIDLANSGNSVIINLTNLRRKGRNLFSSYFSNEFKKIVIIFPILSLEEYQSRNSVRFVDEGKSIPGSVIEDMINGYESIDDSENFDKVINYKY